MKISWWDRNVKIRYKCMSVSAIHVLLTHCQKNWSLRQSVSWTMTCTCLKISNVIQPWVNSYCCSHDKVWKPSLVCWTRTGVTLFSSSLSTHMKCNIVHRMHQTHDPEVQWNVRGLKADKSRDLSTAELSDLANSSSVHALHSLGVDTDFILSGDPQSTHMEYISCVSAGSVNCLFTDCDQWCSQTFSCPGVTVQPVNYKEWGRDADTTSGCCRPQKTAAGHPQVDTESH